MDDEDFEEFRRGGAGKWVILVLLLLAAGAGGFYLLDPDRALDLVGLGQEGAQAGEDPASLAEDAEEGEALAADEQAGSEDEEGRDETVESRPDAAESDEDDPGQEEGGEDPAQEEAAEDEAESPAEERAADEEEEVEAAVQEEEPAQKVARQPQRRPPTYRSLLRRAGTARNRGRIETALDLYGEASKLRPNGAEAYSGQGFCYIEMRAWHAAIAAFEQALEHNSRYGEAIIGAAEAHRLQGNTNRAKRYYQRYIELYPDGPEAAVAQTNLERM